MNIKNYEKQYQILKTWGQRFILILKTLNDDINRSDLFRLATSMAYTTLLSIVPSLAVVFSLLTAFYPIVGDDSNLVNVAKDFIFKHLATGSGEVVVEYLQSFLAKINPAKIGIVGFAGLMFTMILLLRQIELALNRIWMIEQERSFFNRFLYFWTFLTLGGFVAGLVVGVVAKLNSQLTVANQFVSFFIESAQVLVSWGGNFIFFFILYKIVPNCYVKTRNALMGALVSSVLFYLASHIYAEYVNNVDSYKSIYGTLAALPLFLLWLYIIWLIILLGAVFAWRYGEGYRFQQTQTKQHLTHPDGEYGSKLLDGYLPFVLLTAVQQEFEISPGTGVSIDALAKKLGISSSKVSQGLKTLEQLKFLHKTELSVNGSKKASQKQECYFPSWPAHGLDFTKISSTLAIPTASSLEMLFPYLEEKLKRALLACAKNNFKSHEGLKFQGLLS